MEKRYCGNCGADILEGNKYCVYCGSSDTKPKYKGASANSQHIPIYTHQPRGIEKVARIVFFIVFIMVALFIGSQVVLMAFRYVIIPEVALVSQYISYMPEAADILSHSLI